MLHTVITPPRPNTTPVLIAHGLFGSARNWGAIAKRLAEHRQVISVDMRNHGASDWSASHTYTDMADDLAQVITAHGGQADVIGHSMGGKAAMVLALTQPQLVRRLIVADIAPVAYSHTQLEILHAMTGLNLSPVETRSDADRELAKVISDAGVRAFLLQSLDIKAKAWRLNLEALEAAMPDIMGFPDVTGPFNGPALFLSGGNSDYVLPQHRAQIKALFPQAHLAKIPDTGHWLHAEKPHAFAQSAQFFLSS